MFNEKPDIFYADLVIFYVSLSHLLIFIEKRSEESGRRPKSSSENGTAVTKTVQKFFPTKNRILEKI